MQARPVLKSRATPPAVSFSATSRLPRRVYTARVDDPNLYDAGFASALVDQLAAHIAYPITQKTETAVRLAQLARAALADAMAADFNEAAAAAGDRMPDWIDARN